MKKILVITNNLNQASFRLRVEAIIPLLEQRGMSVEVKVRPRRWLARRRLLRSAHRYDAVLLQRKLLDPTDARVLKRSKRPVFFDVDDAVMFHNGSVGWLSRWRTWRRFVGTARMVDHVVAGNEYLADIFRRQGAIASIVPTVVAPDRYAIKAHRATDSPALVWIGSQSTLPYLQAMLPVIEAAAQRVPGLRLITIANATLPRSPVPVEHVTWSIQGEAAALACGDIGIAPTPTDRWTLGKCGFKIIQYMAAGLPVIASPVGANAEIVRAGETGFLPESWNEWPDAIQRLADDVELRSKMGAEGRRRVEETYSLQYAADEWVKLLEAERA